MDASSTPRKVENAYYPPALLVAGPSSFQAKVAPKAPVPSQVAPAIALPTPPVPRKEVDQAEAVDKNKEADKDKVPDKEPAKNYSIEKGAS